MPLAIEHLSWNINNLGIFAKDISETINLTIPDGDYETIAGFVLYNLGNIPSVGDSFMHENYRFEITEMKNVRIEQIKITKTRVIKNLK